MKTLPVETATIIAIVIVMAVSLLGIPTARAQSDDVLTLDTPHSPLGYERLLKDHVVQIPLPLGAGFESRFDYETLANDPEQEATRKGLRDRFISVEPDNLDPHARYAWAINTYNFMVIDLIIEHTTIDPPVSIEKIGSTPFGIFDEKRFTVAGTRYSLNTFEKKFLFLDIDRDKGAIPEDLDPRIHFALVCAAKGCPSLWPEPFRPETLVKQLDAVTRNALQSPAHLRGDGKTVHVSKIFEWYELDFGGDKGVIDFLQRYAPTAAGEALENKGVRIVTDIEWDWSLNRP